MALRIWDYDTTRAKARQKKHGEYDLPSQSIGYDILLKLGALSIAAPAGKERTVWEPILAHSPAAHYALQHFIRGLFLRLERGDDPVASSVSGGPLRSTASQLIGLHLASGSTANA